MSSYKKGPTPADWRELARFTDGKISVAVTRNVANKRSQFAIALGFDPDGGRLRPFVSVDVDSEMLGFSKMGDTFERVAGLLEQACDFIAVESGKLEAARLEARVAYDLQKAKYETNKGCETREEKRRAAMKGK